MTRGNTSANTKEPHAYEARVARDWGQIERRTVEERVREEREREEEKERQSARMKGECRDPPLVRIATPVTYQSRCRS